MTNKANWTVSENRSFLYIGRLGTPKGIGYVKGDDTRCIEIRVSLKIIANGIDTGKYARLESKELDDYEAAHAFVESLLM